MSPESQIASLDSNATFHCNATGTPNPKIKWSKEGSKLPRFHAVKDGALRLARLLSLDEGRYICTATNAAGFAQKLVELVIEGLSTLTECSFSSYYQS